MRKVKAGVIGVGYWGRNHARVLSKMRDAELTAVCDIDRENVKAVASNYKCDCYTDIDDFLSESDVDAVVIATPTETHAKVALSVLQYGKHALIEKPMAATVSQAEAILAEASAKGVLLTVGFIERFNPAIMEAKKIMKKGEIGHPILMSSRRVSSWPGRIGDVGVVKDLAIHEIDMARYIFEKDPIEVYASIGKLNNKSFEDYANIMLLFNKGETAFIEANWITPHKVRKLTLTGTIGLLTIDYITQNVEIENNMENRRPYIDYQEPLVLELSHFISCIINGQDLLVNGEDGVKALQIADAALNSSVNHCPVTIS